MIAAENVPNAITGCVRGVLRKVIVHMDVPTVINAIVTHAIMKKKIFIHAVDAMSKVASIVDSKGINRDNCNAQHVSNRVWGWTRY